MLPAPRGRPPGAATSRALAVVPEFGPFDEVSDAAHALYIGGYSDRAVAEARRWQPFARQAGDGPTLRYLLYTEAIALQQLGRYGEAVEVARELLTVAEEHETVWRAKALALLAEASSREGMHRRALSALAEADWLVGRIPPGTYGHLSASMAVALALRSLNLFEEAEARLAAPDFRVSPHTYLYAAQELAELSVTWAVTLSLVGEEEQARAQLCRTAERGLLVQRLAREVGDPAMVARGLVYEAYALHRLGLEDAAHQRLREAEPGLQQRSELVETQLARMVHAHAAMLVGEDRKARDLLEQVIQDAMASRREVWLATALTELAEVDIHRNGATEATWIWRSVATNALRRVWEEREGRFDALRDREDIRRLTAEADWMGRAVVQDPLTGLGNRRLLQATLDTASREPSVVFIDVDDFKSINDRHSHEVGDQVLRRVGHVLRAQCRSEDVVVRYGGDEFLILSPPEEGRPENLAARVHRAVRGIDWSDLAPGLLVTVSVGVGHPGHGGTSLAAADGALLEAKRRGRDQVVTSADSED